MPSFPRRIRTGLYEIDLTAGQISRQGHPVPVQEQPFRVLAMLVDRPGELVSRDEIRGRLWPADTYVSFDEGLNTAVRKLRIAFQDSADNPRFIQTVPKRGYRFIAPVAEIAEETTPENLEPLDSATIVDPVSSYGKESARPQDSPSGHRAGRWYWRRWLAPALCGLAILAAVFYMVRIRPRHAPGDNARSMLVVLPFQNLSGDPAKEYFSDGLTEETITDLGQLSPVHLGVIARTSSMAYKHTEKTIGQIGRELQAYYVRQGRVRRENGRVRISAQLIRVSDQTQLWARSYDARSPGDLIDVQNAIGRAIADEVQVQIGPQYHLEETRAHSQNPAAYDLYLQGRFYWNQRTPPALRKSIDLFQQAIAADPNFAQAYAGLADAYNISSIVGALSSKEASPPAAAAAVKALELDPKLSDAHAALGMEKSHYEFDLPGAKAEFQKAIQLNPSSAYAHLFYSGAYLMPVGLRADAIAEMKKAVELDPLSLPINNFLGETYVLAGDYPAAYQQFQRTIAMNPNFPLVHDYLANLLELMGRFEDAIHEQERANLLSGDSERAAADKAARLTGALNKGGVAGFWKERLAQDLRARQESNWRVLRHRMGLCTGRRKGPGLPVAGEVNGSTRGSGVDAAGGGPHVE